MLVASLERVIDSAEKHVLFKTIGCVFEHSVATGPPILCCEVHCRVAPFKCVRWQLGVDLNTPQSFTPHHLTSAPQP